MTVSAHWLPSFRTVLSTVMVLAVSTVVAGLAMLAWDTGHEAIDRTTRLLATEVARGVEGDLDVLMDRPVRLVERLAARLRPAEGAEAHAEELREGLVGTPEVSHAVYAALGGDTTAVLRTAQGVRVEAQTDEAQSAWLATVGRAAAPGAVWGAVYPHTGHGSPVLEVARMVRDADGKSVGVVGSGFRLDRLETMLAGYAAEHGAIAFLLDPKGQLLVTHHGESVADDGTFLHAREAGHPVIATVAKEVHTLDKDRRVVVGGEVYDAFVHAVASELPERWLLLIAVPRSQFDAPLRRHMQSMLLLTVLALIGAIAVALLVARGVARPLLEVAGGAGRIRDGELEVQFRPQRVRELEHLSDALRAMVGGLRERDRMKDAFARYVSPRLVEKVASNPEALRPGGKLMPAVIVFTDLRGFTALTERLGPVQTVALINHYLDVMVSIVDEHGGFVTDLMGDGLLITFGIGGEPDAPRAAVRCMLAMQRALDRIDRRNRTKIGIRLEMGAGAHLGEVIVGNIGSASRIKYGVMGDAVNTAARVEALTVGGEVLVSESLYRACGATLEVEPAREVPVKGKHEPLRVYAVRALPGPDGLRLPGAEPEAWVTVDVRGSARRLLGKVVSDESWEVRVVAVEDRYLLIECIAALAVTDDLRIDVAAGTVYGRVRRQEGEGRWLVRWTGGAQDPVGLLRSRGGGTATA